MRCLSASSAFKGRGSHTLLIEHTHPLTNSKSLLQYSCTQNLHIPRNPQNISHKNQNPKQEPVTTSPPPKLPLLPSLSFPQNILYLISTTKLASTKNPNLRLIFKNEDIATHSNQSEDRNILSANVAIQTSIENHGVDRHIYTLTLALGY